MDGDVNALIAAGRHGDAEAVLQKELAARPDNPPALDALGVCLYFQNRLDESVSAYRRALALDGNRATTWYNLGTALSDDGNAEEAIAAYRHCLALDPGNESAKYNLSRSLLLVGQWQEGWQLYEARGRKNNPLYTTLDYERWTGEPPGRYVLVLTTEQGIGDAIQFARFAGELKRRGYEVVLWTAALLAPLLKGCAGVGHVFAGQGLKIEGAPVKWSPLMSVPAALGLTPDNSAVIGPLSHCRAGARSALGATDRQERLQDRHGVARQCGPRQRLAPLDAPCRAQAAAEIPGIRLISLQKRPGTRKSPRPGSATVSKHSQTITTSAPRALLDTAAIMANLNMVISVDTMAAHLAGALGRPVWLALDDRPDWRWLLGRSDSPWYPTMRLFRQQRRGDWGAIVAAMAAILRH